MISFTNIIQESYERAAGIVIVDSKQERVLTIWPTNQYGGYMFTFPKGRIDRNETAQQAAQREFEEETGLSKEDVKMGESIGTFSGTTTDTQYFLGSLTSDDIVDNARPPINKELGFPEAEKVEWMYIEDFLDTTTSDRDRKIIMMLKKVLDI